MGGWRQSMLARRALLSKRLLEARLCFFGLDYDAGNHAFRPPRGSPHAAGSPPISAADAELTSTSPAGRVEVQPSVRPVRRRFGVGRIYREKHAGCNRSG